MHNYSLTHIAQIVDGELFLNQDDNSFINDILLDSRKLITSKNILFIALITKKGNGHQYIEELIKRGVANFLISDKSFMPKEKKCNFILVKDSLEALQQFTAHHRKQFKYPVIGITGSNGKTIVKEWLFELLRKDRRIVRSPKSYNSQIGVPLSVWQMTDQHQLAIFEAGISEAGEMDKLKDIIQPDIGIITNIGEAHAENFINHEQKAGEKLKLFLHCDTIVYNLDSPFVQETIIRSGIHKNIKTFTWSKSNPADLNIIEIKEVDNNQTKILAQHDERDISITIPFTDNASIENAIHCWSLLILMGFDQNMIEERMIKLHTVAMRLELKEGINHCTLINDSYNSDINSLTIALDFLKQQDPHKKKTIILSDVLQSGKSDVYLYEKIAELIEQKGVEKIIGIGKTINKHANKFSIEKKFYTSTAEFLEKHLFSNFQNESILIKGARAFEFEKISKALQQKDHQTVMEINLNALANNLNYYRQKIDPKTMIMAMVKAFSYGTGSFEIANILQFHHVDYLAVAYADEGVDLRKKGIHIPIMVMNPDEHSFDSIIQHHLEPEIYNFKSLLTLEKAIEKNIIPRNKPVKIHIKLDTGMHRLGFLPEEIAAVITQIKSNNRIYLQSVFSHLAASESKKNDDFTHLQITRFTQLADQIDTSFSHRIYRHILNSAGIDRFKEAQFDMVRLGISLYGISSIPPQQQNLENVGKLKTLISQIKTIRKGETIGYNRAWETEKDTEVAIIPIGYADGLKRSLSNGIGHLLVKGYSAPIIGNICMDMCMLDVTGLGAIEGDEVIVFGKENPIQKLATEMDTIPYEVLAGISQRVKRIYYFE